MKKIHVLRDRLCEELDEITEEIEKKPTLSMGEIESIRALTHSLKNIDKIIEDDEGGASEYGRSYRRGRDSMGRFTSRDDGMPHEGTSRRGYYEGGTSEGSHYYAGESHGKDAMISKLNKMMEEAEERSDKDAIRRCLSQIQNG